jgi:PEP-CTERM motif
MTNNSGSRARAGIRLVFAVAGLLSVQSVLAQYVSVGGTIRLNDGAGAGPGGEFAATVLSGGSGSFESFCLERNEYFSYGETLRVRSITSGAMSGGVSGGVAGYDPISSQTAYLYTRFRDRTLSNYDFGNATLRQADANSLQNVFWFLEGEINSVTAGLTTNAEGAQAQTWLAEANSAVQSGAWTGLGNVQVLNLFRGANFDTHAQDQLYIAPIPEPETYMMLLAGLGMMGFVARRRQRARST